MIDFTSTHALGWNHPSHELASWDQLGSGLPAGRGESATSVALAHRIARWIGQPRAVLAPSTLHLFWDLFALLARAPSHRSPSLNLHLDTACYPVARWGMERIERDVPVFRFQHLDPEGLAQSLRKAKRLGLQSTPIVVCDGVCASCGRSAPILDYLRLLEAHPLGRLVIDDTQGVGLLGPTGEGSLQPLPLKLASEKVIYVASLAKALGVPLAFLAASHRFVETFRRQAETRQHCSPPTTAALHAALNALDLNRRQGRERRKQLHLNVHRFRKGLRERGLQTSGQSWPFQTLTLPSPQQAEAVQERLRAAKIRCLRLEDINGRGRLGFLLTAMHTKAALNHTIEILTTSCRELIDEEMPDPVLICSLSR